MLGKGYVIIPIMKKQHGDAIFIQRLLDNDQEAWEEFACRFHNCIHGAIFEQFGQKPVDSAGIAEDFLVDIYTNRSKKLSGFRGDSSLETYIWSICRNFCRNIAKSYKQMRKYYFGRDFDGEEMRLIEGDLPPDEQLGKIEISEILKEAVNKLSPNEKTVILLYFFEDIKEEEIAEMLCKSRGWVASYKKRGLEMMKKSLKNFEEY
jgi:RNA polymerase sigma-70 factor, ECF subfamily